jgi:hypothetical protein
VTAITLAGNPLLRPFRARTLTLLADLREPIDDQERGPPC